MKKTLFLVPVIILCVVLCSCSVKWTEEDISKAHTVEITKYNGDNYNSRTVYTITDERTVNNLRNTFSLLELKNVKIIEPTERSFHISFIGSRGVIDGIDVIAGHNAISNGDGVYKITDEMDIERHLNEVIETAPSEKVEESSLQKE